MKRTACMVAITPSGANCDQKIVYYCVSRQAVCDFRFAPPYWPTNMCAYHDRSDDIYRCDNVNARKLALLQARAVPMPDGGSHENQD